MRWIQLIVGCLIGIVLLFGWLFVLVFFGVQLFRNFQVEKDLRRLPQVTQHDFPIKGTEYHFIALLPSKVKPGDTLQSTFWVATSDPNAESDVKITSTSALPVMPKSGKDEFILKPIPLDISPQPDQKGTFIFEVVSMETSNPVIHVGFKTQVVDENITQSFEVPTVIDSTSIQVALANERWWWLIGLLADVLIPIVVGLFFRSQ
jgi:hypothetical protein